MLPLVKPLQLRHQSFSVLPVNLDRACNEEILLFARARLPVVRLSDRHNEPDAPCPLPVLRLPIISWRLLPSKSLDRAQLLQVPGLANTEAAVVVLARLVHAHSARVPHGDDNQPWLLVVRIAVRRRRRGRMGGIFHDADVGDVALAELAIGVGLAEAGLDDAPLLVLEALGAGHTS